MLFSFFIIGAILLLPINWSNLLVWSSNQETNETEVIQSKTSTKTTTYALNYIQKNGLPYVNLKELSRQLSVEVKIDNKNGQVFLFDESGGKISFLKGVSVLEKNGLYYPMKKPLLYQETEIFVPLDAVSTMFQGNVELTGNQATLVVQPKRTPHVVPVNAMKLTSEELISYLSFLGKPIKGAHVSTVDSSLPGAPRTYRKGVHEGIDWYGGETTGVPITRNTPVLSMADGVVVRADHQYREMTTPERQRLLALGKQNNGQTPQYVLDKLRGRSVWVQHDRGVMARYVHLDRIPKNIKVGQKIKKGTILGYVGNSGTSDGAKGNDQGLHLHLDIFIYGQWFWDQFTIKERRMILERVFPKDG